MDEIRQKMEKKPKSEEASIEYDYQNPGDPNAVALVVRGAGPAAALLVRAIDWDFLGVRPPGKLGKEILRPKASENDLVAWLCQCTQVAPVQTPASILYLSFIEWWLANRGAGPVPNQKRVGMFLTRLFEKRKSGIYRYAGIQLKPDDLEKIKRQYGIEITK